jgi:hypothetical protein
MWIVKANSLICNALVKIGNLSVPALIELLKVEKPDDYTGEIPYLHTYTQKNLVARKALYAIDGECVIYRLEKALKEETDKKKKENLSEAITKFRDEIKAGVYNK